MEIKPLQDWIVLEMSESDEYSAGGIIIPDAAKEMPEQGRVIAVGVGKFVEEEKKGKTKGEKNKKFVKTTVKPGDLIFYERYATRKFHVDFKEVVMVPESAVLGHIVE